MALCFVLTLYIKAPKKVQNIDQLKVTRNCTEYQRALEREDWLRALALHAELHAIFLETNDKACDLVYITDLYTKAQKQYASDEEFKKAEDDIHNQLKKDGLCSDQILYETEQ
jgi:hypothetical protein